MAALEDIRPRSSHDRSLLLRETDGIRFFLEYGDALVDVNCPACGEAKRLERAFVKWGFEHKRCGQCRTLFVSPRPTAELLAKYYQEFEAPQYLTQLMLETSGARKRIQHYPRVEKLVEYAEKHGNRRECLVDLGCGSGNFLAAVSDHKLFPESIGTDLSAKCIEACRQSGLSAVEGGLEQFDAGSLDCVTMNDLIEHVFDPLSLLKEVYHRLRNAGIVMIATPNVEGFDYLVMGAQTENLTPPEHEQYFNPESIETLLSRAGFKSIEVSTPGLLDVAMIRRQIDNKGFRLQENQFLDFIFSRHDNSLEQNLQKFIRENRLSSHMIAMGVKA